jgi:hypothetical protein
VPPWNEFVGPYSNSGRLRASWGVLTAHAKRVSRAPPTGLLILDELHYHPAVRYRLIRDDRPPSEESLRAAERARQLGAAMLLPTVMTYFGEFALANVVSKRSGRKAFEELVGERLPNGLWKELKAIGESEEKVELPPGRLSIERLREHVAIASLGLAATARSGGRLHVERRLDRKLSDKGWAALERDVKLKLPRLREVWRQMRESGMVSLPESLLGQPAPRRNK